MPSDCKDVTTLPPTGTCTRAGASEYIQQIFPPDWDGYVQTSFLRAHDDDQPQFSLKCRGAVDVEDDTVTCEETPASLGYECTASFMGVHTRGNETRRH